MLLFAVCCCYLSVVVGWLSSFIVVCVLLPFGYACFCLVVFDVVFADCCCLLLLVAVCCWSQFACCVVMVCVACLWFVCGLFVVCLVCV